MESKILIRPARPGDTGPVFAFLQEVWEGGDYLPSVWSEWLGDPQGQLVVAEVNGEPIGTGRIADLGGGEFWLEGLRVAAGYRGRGVAGKIQRHLLKVWENARGKSIGFLTHRDHTAVHALARATQFTERFRVQMLRWEAAGGAHDFQRREDGAKATKRLASWAESHGLDGRMEADWTYPEITPERLQPQAVWCWRDERAFTVLDHDEWDGQAIAVLAGLCVETEDLAAFFMDLRRLCSMLDLTGMRWFAPLSFLRVLQDANVDPQTVEDLEMVAYLKFR
ncbi:MAG: GNAT family N-acetyltransferase [Anaerolineales bacterium]|nr:GNAT family N-acetyltransferase [Anaerolineales bacterium]